LDRRSFAFALVDNIIERPDGVIICEHLYHGSCGGQRGQPVPPGRRSVVHPISHLAKFLTTEDLWAQIKGKKVSLASLRMNTPNRPRSQSSRNCAGYYAPRGAIAFYNTPVCSTTRQRIHCASPGFR
jgi:hypothetical protein